MSNHWWSVLMSHVTPIAINGFGSIFKSLPWVALREDVNVSPITRPLTYICLTVKCLFFVNYLKTLSTLPTGGTYQ